MGSDGPYISEIDEALSVIEVVYNKEEKRTEVIKQSIPKDQRVFTCQVDNEERDSFQFVLRKEKPVPPPSEYSIDPSTEIFVISDIEGNFNSFYSLLTSNKVIDTSFNWIYGKNHFVLLGDAVDRGRNVIPILWLLYKLEGEAEYSGGMVHYLLGNHEQLNFQLDYRYVHSKYLSLAMKLSGTHDEKDAFRFLLEQNSVLNDWIKSKNSIEKIGENLLVHAGISPQVMEKHLPMDVINEMVRKNITKWQAEDETEDIMIDSSGPLWYRGYSMNYFTYSRASEEFVDEVLSFYSAKRIIVGHTVVKNVSADYNGKIIKVDVEHPTVKFSEKSEGLLIKNDVPYRANGKGDVVSI